MNFMKEQPVLTVGVSTGALGLFLLAVGAFVTPSGKDAMPHGPGPASVVLLVEAELRPGTQVFAVDCEGSGMVQVGRVVGRPGEVRSGEGAEQAWPFLVDGADQESF